MNFPHFIAQRIAFSDSRSFTKVIIRIAIAAVALSVTTMLVTSAIMDGFKKEIHSKVYGFWGHIHITDTNINQTFEQVPIQKNAAYIDEVRNIEYIDYQAPVKIFGKEIMGKYKQTRTIGGVSHVQPFALKPGILSTKDEFGAIVLKGVDEDFDWKYLPNFITAGNPLSLDGASPSSGVVISSVTAKTYGLEVGQKFIVSFFSGKREVKKAFQVKGVYNTGLEEYDKRFALVDLRKVQDLLQWSDDEVTGFEVFLDDTQDLDIISEYIYADILPGRLYAETIKSKFPSIFQWIQLQDINEISIWVLMVIVAIINMITILLVFILERTGMIGLLKSLGGTNWDIRKVFLYNAAYIILFGLIIGNVLGIGICLLQDHFKFIRLDEASYYLSYAPILLTWKNWLIINVGTFIITIIFLVLPTHLISKISPIKVLRFE